MLTFFFLTGTSGGSQGGSPFWIPEDQVSTSWGAMSEPSTIWTAMSEPDDIWTPEN